MKRAVRRAAGLLVLVAACVICGRLLPVYWSAWRLQRYLGELAQSAESEARSEEWLRAMIVSRGARLGLPVRSDQVRLERSEGRLRIEVRYVAPVRLAFYTVDLHFHPRVGWR